MNGFKFRVYASLLVFVCCGSIHAQGGYAMFHDGQTDYVISVGEDATEAEQAAATVLQDYLFEISKARFPVVAASTDKAITLDIPKGDKEKDFLKNSDSFSIVSDGAIIHISGANEKSLLYAVYAFLEESFGCRWYTSDVKEIPKRDNFSFSKINITEASPISFRSVDYIDVWDPAMAIPNRNNCQFHGPQKTPFIDMLWLEHSFDVFVPTSQYFETHPEYYSYHDGKRHDKRNQLCLSNKEVMEITIRQLRQYIKDHPEFKIYNVAQNDNQNYCRCDECSKLARKYGGESGIMIWFVNQVADAVRDEFPDKYIGTFAYQYTRQPPKNIEPRDNVAIILCTIECDFSHPFTHKNNKKFLEDLDNWKEITTNILIWDYVVNYRHYFLPHPNFDILQENIQILRDAGVLGILEQANGQSRGSEFFGLRSYLLTKLLWDPDCNARAVIEDYIGNYYGSSSPYILEYFDLVQSLVGSDTFLSFSTKATNPVFTSKFIKKADALFDKAEKAASADDVILRRVELARLQITYLKLVTDLVDCDKEQLLKEFIEITSREGIEWSSEGLRVSGFVEKFNSMNSDGI
ncbi:MAG: hypothetical protein DRP64_04855 [Verrucomicrobia bacterium]|nr:MAG: hypothetical protein DRP64_04855 [Verrucomicrobiota bacterium]